MKMFRSNETTQLSSDEACSGTKFCFQHRPQNVTSFEPVLWQANGPIGNVLITQLLTMKTLLQLTPFFERFHPEVKLAP
jgi:hypothetical protein